MQKITPFLWYDKEAREAAHFYTSIFKNSKIKNSKKFSDTPSGTIEIITIQILGQEFTLMSAGPYFKFNPSISFIVGCETKKEVDYLFEKLSDKGKILMPLDKYPFSERYCWIQDKYGLSWQLILTKPEGENMPKIVPSLLFVGDKCGKAEEAINFYLSVFNSSKKGNLMHYGEGQEPNKKGTVMFADFMIENYWLAAMDSALEHPFTFNEAISFLVSCKTQKEIDYYWKKLTADGGEESMCGWLKDKYGLSWQIVPKDLDTILGKDKTGNTMKAMLQMKKLDIEKLREAGKSK